MLIYLMYNEESHSVDYVRALAELRKKHLNATVVFILADEIPQDFQDRLEKAEVQTLSLKDFDFDKINTPDAILAFMPSKLRHNTHLHFLSALLKSRISELWEWQNGAWIVTRNGKLLLRVLRRISKEIFFRLIHEVGNSKRIPFQAIMLFAKLTRSLRPKPKIAKPKIGIMVGSMALGGAQVVVEMQAKRLLEKGYDVALITGDNQVDSLHLQRCKNLSGHVVHLTLGQSFLFDWLACRKLIKKHKFDVIISHLIELHYISTPLFYMCGVKYLINYEHSMSARHKGWLENRHNLSRLKWSYRLAFRSVMLTETARQEIISDTGFDEGKFTVIPNGIEQPQIDLENNPSIRREILGSKAGPVLTVASRLASQKNLPLFIEAIRLLKLHYPDVVGAIFGDGPEGDALLETVAREGLADSVKFMGVKTNVHEYLANSDICILTSRQEGQPIVILEAMALGIPVVSTDVGGISQLISNEREGMLVPSDDAQALCKACRRILDSTDFRDQLTAAAHEKFQNHFSAEKNAEALVRILDEMA